MKPDKSIKGIIIKISNSKHSDKIITILTENGDRVDILAKNIRKSESKRAQSIELGNFIHCKIIEGYGMRLLSEVRVIDEFLDWRKEFKSILFLQMICELTSYFIFENNEDPRIFDLLKKTLLTKTENYETLISAYILKLMKYSGSIPEIGRDVNTLEKITSENSILNPEGIGYIRDRGEGYLNNSILFKSHRYFEENEIEKSHLLKLSSEEKSKLLNTTLNWVENIIDKKVKSREVLKDIRL